MSASRAPRRDRALSRMVFDDEVDVGDGDPEALDDLALRLGLAQLVAGAPRDDVAPVLDERLERLLEVQDRRAALRRWRG